MRTDGTSSEASARRKRAAAPVDPRDTAAAKQAERFAAIIDIGTQISSARDIDALLITVVERLSALLEAEAASLFMFDAETRELWSRVLRGSTLREIRVPAAQGIVGHVLASGKTLYLADAYTDPRFNPEIDRRSGFKTKSIIAAPLRHVSGRVLGVLEVLHRKVGVFTPDDLVLVEGVASQIAAVLDNVMLLEELRNRSAELAERVRNLDALYDIEKVVSAHDERTDLLDHILGVAIAGVQAKAGSILLAEDEGGSLFFRSTRGERSEALKSLRLKAGRGIAGHVTATGEIIRAASADDSEFFDRGIAKQLGVPIGSVLCVPIQQDGRTLGALELLNKKSGFTEGDERLAVLLAGQIGRALIVRESRAEEERKARLASIGQVIAGMLHDLRTPLTVISGYAELLADEDDRATRALMSTSIVSQLEHVSAMQRETLAFARGERSLLKRKIFIHVFMAELEEQLAQEFKRGGVELRVNIVYRGAARLDENKIKRAVHNLARNSMDAMPEGGRFTLSVTRDGDDVIFSAADNGPGIPEEIADRLFESFVTSGKKNGTGLGLAIVKKIAEEHEGSVTFKSKPGKGATFDLRIPAGVGLD